nr:hypothetical protein [Tanacetum cinerariifolium]
MAYTSRSDTEVKSCSKNYAKTYEKLQKQFDEQRQTLNKANLEIVAYQLGLESVEKQLIVHQKNEVAYEEKIAVLEFKVKDKVVPSVFDSRSSDGNDNPTNDRFKKGNGYHAVPPPLTRNYMPPLADLSFTGLDNSVYRPTANKASASISKVEQSVSDDEDTLVDTQVEVKPSFTKIEFTKARNESFKSDKQAGKPKMVTQNSKADRKDWNGNLTQKPRISKKTVNTVRVNVVNTVGQTSVSTIKGNEVTVVKTLAGSFKCRLITTPQMVINSPCLTNKKELAIPGKMVTGKELSNPLMAGSLPKPILPTKLKKHKPKKKHTKEPKVPSTESQAEHNVPLPSPSHDLLPRGEDSLKLKELMDLCTNLSNKILDLEGEVINIKSTYKAKIEKLESMIERLAEENRVLKELKSVHSTIDFDEPVMEKEESSKQGRKIAVIDADVEINLDKVQAKAYNLDLDHQEMVLSMLDVNDEESAGVEEVLEVVTAAKLITKVVTTIGVDVNAASVQDTPITVAEATKEVKRSERLTNAVMKYQALKRKPLTKAQARRNMIIYLKNMIGYKMNYFKGMSYDEIRPLFEKHYNYNQAFLNEVNEGIKVPEKEITKKQKMEQEAKELKKRLQIVLDDDDDVYTDATHLASKIPIVDYKIHTKRNKPYFKINRVDGNHGWFMSFSTMMKNFDREDLESLWKIVRERFEKI